MVALEAAAHGVWTVAFDVGGVKDAVAVGKSGILVEEKNYNEFILSVEKCLSELNKEDRENARKHAMEYDWDHYGRKLGDILRKIEK